MLANDVILSSASSANDYYLTPPTIFIYSLAPRPSFVFIFFNSPLMSKLNSRHGIVFQY